MIGVIRKPQKKRMRKGHVLSWTICLTQSTMLIPRSLLASFKCSKTFRPRMFNPVRSWTSQPRISLEFVGEECQMRFKLFSLWDFQFYANATRWRFQWDSSMQIMFLRLSNRIEIIPCDRQCAQNKPTEHASSSLHVVYGGCFSYLKIPSIPSD